MTAEKCSEQMSYYMPFHVLWYTKTRIQHVRMLTAIKSKSYSAVYFEWLLAFITELWNAAQWFLFHFDAISKGLAIDGGAPKIFAAIIIRSSGFIRNKRT